MLPECLNSGYHSWIWHDYLNLIHIIYDYFWHSLATVIPLVCLRDINFIYFIKLTFDTLWLTCLLILPVPPLFIFVNSTCSLTFWERRQGFFPLLHVSSGMEDLSGNSGSKKWFHLSANSGLLRILTSVNVNSRDILGLFWIKRDLTWCVFWFTWTVACLKIHMVFFLSLLSFFPFFPD